MFMKAGDSETRKSWGQKKQQGSLGRAAVGPLESQRKGALETGSGSQPRMSLPEPVAPLAARLVGTLSI